MWASTLRSNLLAMTTCPACAAAARLIAAAVPLFRGPSGMGSTNAESCSPVRRRVMPSSATILVVLGVNIEGSEHACLEVPGLIAEQQVASRAQGHLHLAGLASVQ